MSRDTKLRAIIAVDAVGYSSSMEVREFETDKATKQRLSRISEIVVLHGGECYPPAGDGCICIFASAVAALNAAFEIQADTARQSIDPPENSVVCSYRCGLHIGEVFLDHDQVTGRAVNVAARLQSLSRPGGIACSRAVFDAVGSRLKCGFQSIGLHKLKNIRALSEVFFAYKDGSAATMLPSVRVEHVDANEASQPSIAVFPFVAPLEVSSVQWGLDTLLDLLVGRLSSYRELSVISSNSTKTFVDRWQGQVPLKSVRDELGATYSVTGGIHILPAGELVAVLRMDENESMRNIWTGNYQIDANYSFKFLKEITEDVVLAIKSEIDISERVKILSCDLSGTSAYPYYVRGHALFLRFSKSYNREARKLFKKAVELDSGFARAYSALSKTHSVDWRFSWVKSRNRSISRALELAEWSRSLDPRDARVRAELGFVYTYRKSLNLAMREYEISLDICPNDADVLAEYADTLVYVGDTKRAIDVLGSAIKLNPCYPDYYMWYLGGAYFQEGEYSLAIDCLEKMINPLQGRRLMAASYAYLSDLCSAREQANLIKQDFPDFSAEDWLKTQPFKDPSRAQHLTDGLKMAGL